MTSRQHFDKTIRLLVEATNELDMIAVKHKNTIAREEYFETISIINRIKSSIIQEEQDVLQSTDV